MRSSRAAWAVVSGAVVVVGAVLVLVEGRRGFMPLDQSIVFDAGWRILSGQVPLRDVLMPAGLVPGVVQAAFFSALGVTWWAYLAHGALANAAFGLLVLWLAARLGLRPLAAGVYALASVVVFVPPFGSPSLEQPSFGLGLLAVALGVLAATGTPVVRAAAAAGLPGALALGVLSKQIPAALLAPLAVGMALSTGPRRRTAGWLAVGLLTVVITAVGVAVVAGVSWEAAVTQLWSRPRSVAAARMRWTPSPLWGLVVPPWTLVTPALAAAGAGLLAARGRGPRWWAAPLVIAVLASAAAVIVDVPAPRGVRGVAPAPPAASVWAVAAAGAALGGLVWAATGTRGGPTRAAHDAELPVSALLWLAGGSVLVCTVFVALTDNQVENGLPLVFVGLAALHAAAVRLGRDDPGRYARLAATAALVLPLVALGDTARFHLAVNQRRVVHDVVFDANRATTRGLPPGLDLELDGPLAYDAAQLGRVVDMVRAADGDVLVLGDTTIVAPLAGKPSISPALWWHPGLVVPEAGDPGFDAFDARLAATLADPTVSQLVVETAANPWSSPASSEDAHDGAVGPRWAETTTWMGVRLADYPRSLAVAGRRACGERHVGGFTVVSLCASSSDDALAQPLQAGDGGPVGVRGRRAEGGGVLGEAEVGRR